MPILVHYYLTSVVGKYFCNILNFNRAPEQMAVQRGASSPLVSIEERVPPLWIDDLSIKIIELITSLSITEVIYEKRVGVPRGSLHPPEASIEVRALPVSREDR